MKLPSCAIISHFFFYLKATMYRIFFHQLTIAKRIRRKSLFQFQQDLFYMCF